MRHGSITPKTIQAAATPVCGPAPNRDHLILGGGTAGQVTYSTDPNVVNGGGLVFGANAPPLILCRHTVGDLIERPWYAIASAGPVTVGVLETIDDGKSF